MGKSTVKEVLVQAGKGKAKRQKGGGAKKIGRSKVKCARYKGMGIREKNKKRNIAKDAKFKAKKKAEKATHAYIDSDDWLHETWEHNGKKYKTAVPPRLGGNNGDIQKEWDGAASLRMAEIMAGVDGDTLGQSHVFSPAANALEATAGKDMDQWTHKEGSHDTH